jgi:hypothetical protein
MYLYIYINIQLDRNLVIVYEITHWFKRENYHIFLLISVLLLLFNLI